MMANYNDKAQPTGWALKPLPEMDNDQFRKWQELLESRTGMSLPIGRKVFLQTSLGIRMREIGCSDYQEYFEKVISGPGGIIEWTTLVDRLTVQETRFYRDIDACNLVTDYVLTRPIDNLKKSSLEVWSVGCSTGEEPYTLAMLLSESMYMLGLKHYYGITGTDISTPALEKARAGIYTERKLVTVEDTQREKYFKKHDNGQYEVIPAIKDRVCFARVNILDLGNAPMHGMNVIFCQNVLIYFRRWRRKEILSRLVERLVPGGLLVLGQGEMVDWEHPDLERVPSDNTLAFIRRPEKN
ncbi:CheR family methyltransferase [Alkalimarinus sediminis]|uniref:protein-glutamate O-methyltransferase n=1 Tax=Alkalimarinus sediminis TaxID=1632866 RepID=A0A9E8HHU7_9ALTE|nr:CheR family methyltransferase [Alkalimarinus sediminis]UZW74590.1 protein-glutamate O-methyltransferase CheR [Alkalimarinus sediminis]